MRRWLSFFLLCLLPFTQLQVAVAAEEVVVPALTARVTDLTGTLTAEQKSTLEARLQALETQKGSQLAVLLVPTTQPETIEQYSIRVVDQWKLGRKKVDDGVLLLIAKDDRKLRIEVGYGLEGALPDVIAKRIIAEDITPHFKQGDFYGGIVAGITRIDAVIQGEALPSPQQKNNGTSIESYLFFLVFFALISGSILRRLLGTFPGALVNGGLVGIVTMVLGGGILFATIFGIVAFFFALIKGGGGFGGGGFGGGGFSSGGGFSGGGGGFGGGGASGNW